MALDDLKQLTASLQTPEETRQRDIGRDFKEARQRADLQEVLARLKGQSNQLWSFDEIKRQLRLSGKVERGRQEIPLAAIVGSVGRYADFTRTFLPRQDSDQDRWVHVRSACIGPVPQNLPPIEVYKVGKAYFVLDGHHRVSVARERGLTHIEAYVTVVPTKVPLGLDLKPDELIAKAECARFLEETGLAETPDTLDLSLTAPAG